MTPWAFVLSISLILITPGPTNIVVALGGYSRGWLNALPLVVAELSAYLAVIVPVATLVAPLFRDYPVLAIWSKALACVWVVFLAYGLWISGQETNKANPRVSVRQVFITTLLNPKAVIIGLVIMPHGSLHQTLPWFIVFAVMVTVAANAWICFGTVMRRTGKFEVYPRLVQRTAAGFLMLFAIILGTSAVFT